MKTAILGAGVTGLALGRLLVEGGLDSDDLVLFESAPEIGGLCGSKTVDGFTYDVTGGHILFSKDKAAMRWMMDCAGGDDGFVQRDRETKIRFADRWVHYPFENGLGDLPEEANFDCIKGYVEAWHERLAKGTVAPADFEGWIEWRFGPGICKHFMRPYNEKIWKRPLEDVTSSWVAGRVPEAPIEDVLRASIGMRTQGYTHQSMFYYPKHGGFQAITDGIGSTLGANVRLSTPVESLVRHGDGWRVNGEDFDRVVSTIALNFLPDIIEGLPDDVSQAMRALEYNSMTCFLLALSRPEHPNLSWVYLPHHEQGPTNRVTYMSNYSPNNAPEGHTSFLCEVTTPGGQPYPGPELVDEVVGGMEHAGLLSKDEILFTDRTDTRFAYIVYDHGFETKRERSLSWLRENGITPLGRFGRYDYYNSDQCVIAAREVAQEMLEEMVRG